MMIVVLWAPLIAAFPGQPISNPVHAKLAHQCQASLVAKVEGEISSLTVEKTRHAGHVTEVKGTLTVLQKPAPRPGELTPSHVISARYSYVCRVNGRRVTLVKVSSTTL